MEALFNTLGKLFFGIIVSYLLLCLTTYIVMDIADLFNVKFITDLGYVTVFAVIFIIRLINVDSKAVREYIDKADDDSNTTNSFVVSVVQTILLLCIWAIAYMSFWFLVG
jgi:hypothetical protein